MRANPWGVTRPPFRPGVDAGCFFLAEGHREAMAALFCAISRRACFTSIIGLPGAGKTSLVASALRRLQALSAPVAPRLFDAGALPEGGWDARLGARPGIPHEESCLAWAAREAARGRQPVLLIDNAQKLSPLEGETLAALMESSQAAGVPVPVITLGQPVWEERLHQVGAGALYHSREVEVTLPPLSLPELYGYLEYRWLQAGGEEPPFTPAAISVLHRLSAGIPRVINTFARGALERALEAGLDRIEEHHLQAAAMAAATTRRRPQTRTSAAGLALAQASNT